MAIWEFDLYSEAVEEAERLLDEYVEARQQGTRGTQSVFDPLEQAKLTHRFWMQPASLSELATQYGVAVSTVSRTIERVEVWVLGRIKKRLGKQRARRCLTHLTSKWLPSGVSGPKPLVLFKLMRRREKRRLNRLLTQKRWNIRNRGRPVALGEDLYRYIIHQNKFMGFSIEEMCRRWRISRASFYRYLARRKPVTESNRYHNPNYRRNAIFAYPSAPRPQSFSTRFNYVDYFRNPIRPWIDAPYSKTKKRRFTIRGDERIENRDWYFEPKLRIYLPLPCAPKSLPVVSGLEFREAVCHLESQNIQVDDDEDIIFETILQMREREEEVG